MRVVLYGSRPDGHARVVLEVLVAEGPHEVVGLIDDVPENSRRTIGMLGVIGTRDDLQRLAADGVEGVILGFGAAKDRDRVVAAIEAASLELPTLVHPSAYVAPSARLAAGVQILPHVSVGPGADIGRGVLINTGAVVEHDVVVGDYAVVDPCAVLAGRVKVGQSVEIGARAVVLPDIEVGAHAVLGAGAVATRGVTAHQTVAGVPARPLERSARDC